MDKKVAPKEDYQWDTGKDAQYWSPEKSLSPVMPCAISLTMDKKVAPKEDYQWDTGKDAQYCSPENSLSNVTSSNFDILSAENGTQGPDPAAAADGHFGVNHPTSFLETLIHLLKGNIGSALYAMGDAFRNAGLVAAPCIALFLGVICVYAQHMLLAGARDLQQRTGSAVLPTYAEVLEFSFKAGPPKLQKWAKTVRLWINIFLCVTQMGVCCVYFLFISDNVKQVLDYYDVTLDIHVYMAIFLLPLMLSCWIRDLKYLVPLSLFANFAMVVSISVTLYYSTKELPAPSTREYIASWSTIPLFFGTVIFAFEGIGLVLPLQSEMKKPEQFIRRFGVLNIGMTIVTSLILVMGFIGYLKYGDEVKGSLTLNLPQEEILVQVVQLLISLAIMFSYALQMYVPISILWPKVQKKWGPFKYSFLIETIFRSTLVVITFTLAEAIPHLSLFISLVGAVSSAALALFFPAVLDLATNWESGLGPFKWLLWKNGALILIGVIGFITGTYASVDAIISKMM